MLSMRIAKYHSLYDAIMKGMTAGAIKLIARHDQKTCMHNPKKPCFDTLRMQGAAAVTCRIASR